VNEATAMANYLVSSKADRLSSLPLQGTFTPTIPAGDTGRGALVLRAVYTDKGAGQLPVQTAEAVTVLRSPRLGPVGADIQEGITAAPARGTSGAIIPKANSHIGYRALDLTGIARVDVAAQASPRNDHVGGTIEVRLGSPTGPVVGQGVVALPGGRGGTPTAAEAQTAGVATGGRGRGGAAAVQIPLKPTTGVHDLYFVFRNPAASSIQPLMTVSSITLAPQ
jgi:cytochrome c